MKVGILTHYNVYNQGALLQMTAMHHWLKEQGHEPVILTYEKNFDFMEGEKEKNSGSLRALPYYLRHYLMEKGVGLTWFNTRKVLAMKQARKQFTYAPYNDSGCDAVVIGADEVYSIDVGCNPMMYGHGLGGVPAIAYAPAFGRTTMETLAEYNCTEIVRSGLTKMAYLSARDTHTREMVAFITGREVPMVCDPVLLYSGKYNDDHKQIGRPYLLVYAYDSHMTDPAEINAIRSYAKANGLITVSLGTYHSWCDRNIACSAEEWYGYFKEAACVVTDTFHGSVAAMKNHCNVAVFIRESINAFKLRSLLEETGLEHRRLKTITRGELEDVLSRPIDYDVVDSNIAKMAARSEAYLKAALEDVHGKH